MLIEFNVDLGSTEFNQDVDQVSFKGRLRVLIEGIYRHSPVDAFTAHECHVNGTIFHIYLKNGSYKSYAVFTDTVSKSM